jgi:hypothetical protein
VSRRVSLVAVAFVTLVATELSGIAARAAERPATL